MDEMILGKVELSVNSIMMWLRESMNALMGLNRRKGNWLKKHMMLPDMWQKWMSGQYLI